VREEHLHHTEAKIQDLECETRCDRVVWAMHGLARLMELLCHVMGPKHELVVEGVMVYVWCYLCLLAVLHHGHVRVGL
jgi:hypothetical protein